MQLIRLMLDLLFINHSEQIRFNNFGTPLIGGMASLKHLKAEDEETINQNLLQTSDQLSQPN